jgi:hypothetical protein
LIVLSLVACATQRYGRMTPVSPGERANLSCDQIALEIEKAEFFLADIRRQRSQTTGAHVLGALGDFGIGNVMEGDAAEKSGIDRLDQLKALERDKGCVSTGTASASPAPNPEGAGSVGGGAISTREEFERRVVGRQLANPDGTVRIVLNADGTMSGTRGDGARLSGPWYFDDGYFCREPSFGGKSQGWDCQVVTIEDDELIFHRNRGTGERVKYRLL